MPDTCPITWLVTVTRGYQGCDAYSRLVLNLGKKVQSKLVPKLTVRVRFPSPALLQDPGRAGRVHLIGTRDGVTLVSF